jgi:hypothetical protein
VLGVGLGILSWYGHWQRAIIGKDKQRQRNVGKCRKPATRFGSSHGSKSFAVTLSIAIEGHIHEFDTCICCVFTDASSLAAYGPVMLVLYETAMGFALFKLTDSAKLTDPNLHKEFDTPERANGLCVQNFHCRGILILYTVYVSLLCTG